MKKPIFIFGCCNSGTTILWQAIKKHKSVSGPHVEGQDLEGMPHSMRQYHVKSTLRLWAHPQFKLCYYRTEKNYNEHDKQKIIEVFNQHIQPRTRLVTKSPPDTLRARLIQSYFHDAYFVAIVRNGYAISEGIVRKRKYDPERPQFKGLFTSIDEAAEQWFRSNAIIVSHEKYLRKYKIIKYEDLIEDPKSTLLSILDFCGLDNTDFPIPRFIKGLNEEQISRLSEYEIETITRIAQPMLIHFDYEIRNKELKWEKV